MAFEQYLIDQGQSPDIVDESTPNITYIGWCDPGTQSTLEPKFKIKRIETALGITKTFWANGEKQTDKIWDNRATYTYTFLK